MKSTKNYNKAFPSVEEELFGVPFEIPISFNGVKLGNVIIDYKVDKNLLGDTKLRKEIGYLTLIVIAELLFLKVILKKDIELAIRFDEKKRDDMKKFLRLLCLFHISPDQQHTRGLYYLVKDDVIFELIKSEGPISLCNSWTQMMINYWLSEKNIANRKINKLRDSLMEYAYGRSFKDKLFETGRPEIKIFKELGKKWIKDMYEEITSILKIAKRIQKHNHIEEINELIVQAFNNYILSLQEKYKKDQASTEIRTKLIRLKTGWKNYKDMGLPNPISECIKGDEDLEIHFNSPTWEPNELAKEVIAKLLNVSMSKIISILYR